MAGSTRIKGNALYLNFGSPGTDYKCDATSVVLQSDDSNSGVTTFCDAANPEQGRQWSFAISAIQSTQKSSFWRYLWDNVGSEVAFTYAPHGNSTASQDKPHFIGTVKIPQRPQIGGDASVDGEYTFDISLTVETGPVLDDGAIPDWEASTAYDLSDAVKLTGGAILECQVAGTSGSSAPTAPGVGESVTDGDVNWVQVSAATS